MMRLSTLYKQLTEFTVYGLKWNKETLEFDEVPIECPVFRSPDGDGICVSGEHENSYLFLDYYGEHRGGYAWIHPELIYLARKADGYWEWMNPGCIKFYRN